MYEKAQTLPPGLNISYTAWVSHDSIVFTVELYCDETTASSEGMTRMPHSSTAPGVPTPRSWLAWACLELACVLPLGLALFVLRNVVAMQPALHPVPSALNLILEGGATVTILFGIPACGVAIALGHIALARVGKTPSARRARWVARTGLALAYLSVVVVLAAVGFTAFWLGTNRLHLVW